MSVSSYRPGVYSSYTIAPSYIGTREALTVGSWEPPWGWKRRARFW